VKEVNIIMAATTQKSKKKTATPPKTSDSSFLKPKKVGAKKTAAKKEKPISHFPIVPFACNKFSLAEKMDQLAAAEAVSRAALRKAAEHRASIKDFLLEGFARTWASQKERPATRTWKAIRSSLDYVMTSYINFTSDKQEQIEEELGINMEEYFEVTGFKIDLAKLQSNKKYFDAFMTFIDSMNQEDIDNDEYVERVMKLNNSFFDKLSDICDHNPDRLYQMLQILDPRANFKNVATSDKEEDLFDFVRNMEG
jgi:hypothetical protein